MPRNWMPPSTPSEIVRGNFTSIRSAENENEALWLACQLKDGDDIWADRHESKFPWHHGLRHPKITKLQGGEESEVCWIQFGQVSLI